MATINIQELLNSLRTERTQKYQTGMGALQRVAGLFGPSYMKGAEKGALASMEQSMAGRGLSNTTRPGALSIGIKQGFEDVRRTRLADALANVGRFAGAGMPSAASLAHLATGGFSKSSGTTPADLSMMMSSLNPLAMSPGKSWSTNPFL